jgi:hypothetical protein
MTVEEYFEEWWTPKELPEQGFNKTAMLDFAEMYHKQALHIHDVVGRSEQLHCPHCGQLEPCAGNSPETCYHPKVC